MSRESDLASRYEGLGYYIGHIYHDSKQIADTLRSSGIPCKEGTLAILDAAGAKTHFLAGKTVELLVQGKRYCLHQEILHNRETSGLQCLEYRKCEVRLTLSAADNQSVAPQTSYSRLQMELPENVVALCEMSFDVHDQFPERCEIYGSLLSREGFEGNGFGLGLRLLTNIVIREVQRRRILPLVVTTWRSSIQDSALSQDKNIRRKGWSTNLALLLGYRKVVSSEGVEYVGIIPTP